MLLKSIKLENFRQFKSEKIDFSTDAEQNVTIIIGDNGTGKTTFAQAFFWCLYGDTDFTDKSMLNKLIGQNLLPEHEAVVRVTLCLLHGGFDYTITREQTYKKNFKNIITASNTTLNVGYKQPDGQMIYLKPIPCEAEIKKILPKELSKYFFFDGERIEKMSKEIQMGRKSSEFAEAVKGLLGLNAIIAALGHLNPRSKYGVIGSYENSYDSKSDANIQKYTEEIAELQDQIDAIQDRLDSIDDDIKIATARRDDLIEQSKRFAEGEKLQSEKETLVNKLNAVKRRKAVTLGETLKGFNANMAPFFTKSMMQKSLELLSKEDFLGKDIPEMHSKTIEYLLNKGTCICGTHLDEGTIPYSKVKELLAYLPPQSIGVTVGQFVKDSRTRISSGVDAIENLRQMMNILSEQEENITEFLEDIKNIDSKLGGGDVHAKVRALHAEQQLCEKNIRDLSTEARTKAETLGGLKKSIERKKNDRAELSLRDDNNRKIEVYKAYAQRVYEELNTVYMESETKIRAQLQETINTIFKTIYDGGMSIFIDEKYNISVYVDEYDGGVETSTAQSIAVIFAFITGIIKMARDNQTSDVNGTGLATSEPYPLVMDAPLSAFDKRRIKTVCEALPSIAEQVIIFIKDTDGDLAEENIGYKVGCRHKLDKLGEFETKLI